MPPLEGSDDEFEEEDSYSSITEGVADLTLPIIPESRPVDSDNVRDTLQAKSIDVRPRPTKHALSLKSKYVKSAGSVCESLISRLTDKTSDQRAKIPLGVHDKPMVSKVF